MTNDLFGGVVPSGNPAAYTASDIEVLEGLEPVRRRPGMYVGGTDDNALHHLAAEIIDNAMDEAVAGHASMIEVALDAEGFVSVRDNGRGIPVDPHPKFPKKSALEVILTTLHSGGKFSGKSYATAGGLHGVGSSVVNALSDAFEVEVARDRTLSQMRFSRGAVVGKLAQTPVQNRRGTLIRFHADPQIFGALQFDPARLYRMCRSKAYLSAGVSIAWSCDPALIRGKPEIPAAAVLHFPGGLKDSLAADTEGRDAILPIWTGTTAFPANAGRVEWAVTWLDGDGFADTYCNTIPTTLGGTHETGFRTALLRGLKSWGENRANKRAAVITSEDIAVGMAAKLSVFLRDPQFQGQTKERLTSPDAAKLVETAMRDRFDLFLGADPAQADALLAAIIDRAEDRIRRRDAKDVARKSPTRRLRLPGKLTDCTDTDLSRTEIFLVEGDSAGGSAKQARNRSNQAVLPLRGKILNVASASSEKLRQNQELRDLLEALGCGSGARFDEAKLRYGRVVIMTDADVDGAHIASLLITFFHQEMPRLITGGHLYLAQPPLYRLTQGAKSLYAMDDSDRDRKQRSFKVGSKVDITRFKGLGEMPYTVLRETTMDPRTRTLLRVVAAPEVATETNRLVENLMGRKPELRMAFIQEHARSADVDV